MYFTFAYNMTNVKKIQVPIHRNISCHISFNLLQDLFQFGVGIYHIIQTIKLLEKLFKEIFYDSSIIVSNQNIIFDKIQPTFIIGRKLQLVIVTRILKVYFDVIYFASKNCERRDDEHRKGNTINCLFRFLLAFLWDHIHITVQKLQAFYFQTVPQ